MPEVLEILRPDQLRLPPPQRPPRRFPWRPLAGCVLLAVLAGSAILAISRPGPGPDSAADARRPAAAPEQLAPSAPPVNPQLDAVARAVAAWEAFARSGDIAQVASAFDEAGPQFRRFQDEATSLGERPSSALQMDVRSSRLVSSSPAEAVVTATVQIARAPARRAEVTWEFVLRKSRAGTWNIWTVRGEIPELGS